MILDSSAVVAILFQEPGFEQLLEKLSAAKTVGIGGPTLAESAIVLSARLNRDSRPLLARLIIEAELETIPFTREHAFAALAAFRSYGKGRHRAALNFGDCLSYAVAKLADLPLLYAGKDFGYTDIRAA